ncbi:hypothetical protein P175DRAFT_0515551 [Aspergillus ochraceoroseus IBT 24754]|uniref:Uncharacterized protein n=2 Tax=Aspergillus ochraceoroseus TaxID=138278 RepID=A0A2T5LYP5_9EURO|nr:uncharacterized protein P175DRAFT_0515551 [Aspergillus ochraceoroseus IBT 24754]KKK12064.1 hypothetical protein AOCH_003759 [Aspergillus ochraceoroseus]PTU21407.1 hypothetical protein P175DRAFT_0515551 [Aspergillus ochraceoroseus IBT 24754]
MSADEGGPASMPATNGERYTATPDPSVLATPGKRKRVSSHDDKLSQDTNTATPQVEEKVKLQETLRNLVEILSKNDTELHLLSCPLPSSPVKPRSKRAKVSGDKDEGASIQARVASDRYSTLSEFLGDIEKASTAVIERNKAQASGTHTDSTPVTETVNRIAAFKKLLNSLVRQAYVSPSNVKAETSEDDTETSSKPASTVEVRNDGLVLTLFGNPANPKQLYSSLQKSVKVPLSSDDPGARKYVEVQTPLREVGLPNGITTTKVVPYEDEKKPKEPKRTFGEVFTPRATLPQLEPPRRPRSSSRAAQVSWIDPFEVVTNYKAFLGDRNNYAFAQLPSGTWLQYGGVSSSPSYWGRRQKQHSSQQPADEKLLEDPILWTDEDSAVLQGVYSSFAPSFDSSGAVVQADSKNLVWWSKRGEKRLNTLLSISDQEISEEAQIVKPGSIGDLDESTLEEMVKSFNPEDFVDASISTKTAKKDQEEQADETSQETNELLADISDLLETLSSYQKIRNLELSSPGNRSAEPKDSQPSQAPSDQPSEAEIAVYDTLKSSLSLMVSKLPPFAVAKLNGDQLAELNISQRILIETPDYHGSMEKDDYSIQQERAAAAAATPVANRTSTPSRPGNYQAQYNQRAYNANVRIQSQGNFQAPQPQPQPYYQSRQPSTSGPYTPGNPQPYAGARPPTTPSQRPGYFPGYAQPTPQYNQGNPVPQFQRPGPNGYNPYTAQPGPPPAQASPQPYTPRPGQPAPYNAAAPYGPGRSTSPQKQPAYVTSRPSSYMTPGSNPQQRFMQPAQAHQQPPTYANYPPNQAANTYSNSAAAMTYARSAAEQAVLMDRNKAQLAAATQSSSSTPQPPIDLRSSQDRSVTPGNKQNGTPLPT